MKSTRREFLKTAGALAAGTAIVGAPLSRAGESQPKRPNILFFYPDQHRFDWIGVGSEIPVRTPHLDAMAARGVRFTNALAPSPLCAPARACLASGKEYDRCRVPGNGADYPLDQTTIYTRLRDSGYHVAGCGKFDLHKASPSWGIEGKHLLPEWGFSDGIDNAGKWDAINSGAKEPRDPYMYYLEQRDLRLAHVADFRKRRDKSATFPTPLPERAYCDNWIAANGLDLIKRAPQDKPWFLQVNFTGPHSPWDITERMETRCRSLTGFPQPVNSTQLDPETHVAIRQNYSAMVENIDRWLGIYIDELERRGELDNTLIVFSSDHGEMLGDHDMWSKSKPQQPSVGVPMVIAGPGVRAGGVHTGPATTLDLSATFLECGGVEVPGDLDARSMRRLLSGETDTHREFALSGLGRWRVAFDGQYKLVRHLPGRKGDGEARHELYDLENDPHETEDIAADKPKVVERLAAILDKEIET